MRVMAYLGTLGSLLALWAAFLLWRRRLDTSRLFLAIATWAVIAPFLMNTAGWMLTENGRQPWIVQGLMKTSSAASPSVGASQIIISLVLFYGIYLLLGVLDVYLMTKYARRGLDEASEDDDQPTDDQPGPRVPVLTY